MGIAGISDFESLATSTNAPVFTHRRMTLDSRSISLRCSTAEYIRIVLASWTWTFLTWMTTTFRLHY